MISLICAKELKSFFKSPIAYVILGLFSLLVGWMFFSQLSYFLENIQKLPVHMRHEYDFSNEVIIKVFGNVNFIFIFMVPILTMRTFAEEFREQTIDLYFGSVVSDFEFILGKFFAVIIQGFALIATTLIFPLLLANINLSDMTFLITGYLGIFFNFIFFATIGLVASSLVKNQIIAAMVAFVGILAAWMLAVMSQLTSNYLLAELLRFLSVNHHFENMVKGYVSFSDFSFYLCFFMFGILLIKKRLEVRKW
ncbi:MAG: hypothetical protein CME62_01960 [Halobacteriovoraceae bacterium]|nr:hypothetical protein [Halobacteriovoraceae bacterium]|tara:strand:- start:23797 stop:24552 length:756 start_codon:yes stop_codon:yes gene_type:complete